MNGIPFPSASSAARTGPGSDREPAPSARAATPDARAFGGLLASMLAGVPGSSRAAYRTPIAAPSDPVGSVAAGEGEVPEGEAREQAGAPGTMALPGSFGPATSLAYAPSAGPSTDAAPRAEGEGEWEGEEGEHAGAADDVGGHAEGDDPAPRGATRGIGEGSGAPTGSGDSVNESATPASGATATSTEHVAAAAAATGAAYRGMSGMVPELREKLQRVVDRMREEHGVRVDVVETFRPQARQDALHAQGRTAPGPVVTWTRNSRHTQGRAVDVTVNGGYTDSRAFSTLQRVAREEGLHTLGMRDPGHLELPARATGGAGVELAALTRLASGAGARVDDLEVPAGPQTAANAGAARAAVNARAAAVARVAQVANVATVASVARVAAPGVTPARGYGAASRTSVARGPGASGRETATSGSAAASATGATGAPVGASSVATTAGAVATSGAPPVAAAVAQLAQPAGQAQRRQAEDRSGTEQGADDGAASHNLMGGGDAGRGMAARQMPGHTAPVAGSSAADALARVDQIDRLRDGSAARPLSQLTLSLDNAEGGTDRIRVGLRGSQVGAVLELSDQALRDQVSSRLGELQGALEQRGLETESLQVRRSGSAIAEGLELGRAAGVAMEREGARGAAQNGASHGQGGQGGSGQSYTPQREREGRPHRDPSTHDQPHRHDPRREPKEDPT